MTKRDTLLFVDDIVEAIEKIRLHTRSVSWDQFFQDDVLQAAVVRWITIVGEAAARIPSEFRAQHSDVPWPDLAGMRNRLVHGYFQVDLDRVWRVVTDDVPELDAVIRWLRESLK